MQRLGVKSLPEEILKLQHMWAGHVARLPHDHPTRILTMWKSHAWWKAEQLMMTRADPGNLTGWRHQRTGTHRRWDEMLCNYVGQDWWVKAHNREKWDEERTTYINFALAELLPPSVSPEADGQAI